jgi:hypothetical protein
VWLAVNIEHYTYGVPALSLYPEVQDLVPDPINYGWRDYGNRVGVWRLMEHLAAAGIPAPRSSTARCAGAIPRFWPRCSSWDGASWPMVATTPRFRLRFRPPRRRRTSVR